MFWKPKPPQDPTTPARPRFDGAAFWRSQTSRWENWWAARTTYTAPLARLMRQAPWRSQTQLTAAWAISLLIIAVVGGLYLAVASRAATAGRDVQTLEAQKTDLLRQNDLLRAELAELRSLPRLTLRARALGFQPARPEQIDYIAVPTYPTATTATALPTNQRQETEVFTAWLAEALTGVLPQWTLPPLPALPTTWPTLPGGG